MNSSKQFFSKIGFNYLVYAIASILFVIAFSNIIMAVQPEILNNINATTIISAICNYILPLPILLYFMRKLEKEEIERKGLTVKTFLKYVCIIFTLTWIGNIVGIILTNLLGFAIHNDISNPIRNLINSTDLWLNMILISIIGPIFEELIFRKILIDRTIKYGAGASIIISATLFGLVHGNLSQFFYTLLVGGFFAYVYIKTGKLRYPIALHMILNLQGSVLALFINNIMAHINAGAINPFELGILLIYFIALVAALFVGILNILEHIKYKPYKKSEIKLKSVFLNAGMLCFTSFFIIKMILQAFS